MSDTDRFTKLYSLLTAGFTARGVSDVTVRQSELGTLLATPSGAAVVMASTGLRAYGYPRRDDSWDEDTSVMTHTESQLWEQTFQITALQQPGTGDSGTPADLLRYSHSILQGDTARDTLRTAGLQLLRASPVRQITEKNDRGVFEDVLSFDITLIYQESYSETITSTSEVEGQIVPV